MNKEEIAAKYKPMADSPGDVENHAYTQQKNQGKSKIPQAMLFALYLIVIVSIFMAEQFFRQPLYDLNAKVVPVWQSYLNQPLIYVLKFITLMGQGHACAIFFVLAFLFSNREKAFYLLLVQTVAGVVNQELKMIYHNGRPYMTSADIQALSCSKSFGNPSGHASLSACYYTTLFLLIFHDKDYTLSQRLVYTGSYSSSVHDSDGSNGIYNQKRIYSRGTYIGSLIFLICFVLSIGMTRVLLGVHSLNQIVFGWSYGLWEALFLFTFIRPMIQRHITFILEVVARRPDLQKRSAITVPLVKAIVYWALAVALTTTVFLTTTAYFEYPQAWLDAMVAKCGGPSAIAINTIFAHSAFIKTGLTSCVFGAYFGILIDCVYLDGTSPRYNDNASFLQGLGRIFITLLVAAPFGAAYMLMPSSSLNIIVLFVFKATIPLFIFMIIMFSVLKILFEKLGLVE